MLNLVTCCTHLGKFFSAMKHNLALTSFFSLCLTGSVCCNYYRVRNKFSPFCKADLTESKLKDLTEFQNLPTEIAFFSPSYSTTFLFDFLFKNLLHSL
jgi:hypothetical protein